MFKLRNLTAVVIALIAVLALMIPFASAQPALQTTETPAASGTPGATTTAVASDTPVATTTAVMTETPMATAVATTTVEATSTSVATAVAPAVSPVSTAAGTPSTLPQTGESDGSTAALALVVLAVGALIVVGAIGLARASRRTE